MSSKKPEFILRMGVTGNLPKETIIVRTRDKDEAYRHFKEMQSDKWNTVSAVYVLTDDRLWEVPLRGTYDCPWRQMMRRLDLE